MTLTNHNSKVLRNGDPEPPALAPGKFRLYNMRFCPYAKRVVLYLQRKGIDCEVINIHLQDKPEWYLKRNPQGKVPCLEHNGKSSLIPQYLDDVFPESSVLPNDPFERIQQKILAEQFSPISSALYGLAASLKDPSLKAEKLVALEKALKDADVLLKDTFFGGSAPSFADYIVFPFIERIFWATHIEGATNFTIESFPGDDYPNLSKWFTAMSNRDEVEATAEGTSAGLKFFQSYMNGSPNYDEGL